MNIWDAERVVEADEARKLIREQFPSVRAEELELLGIGWDNTAYLVDSTYVFRFPRRQIAVPLLEHENRALPAVAPLLPVLVPHPEFIGEPTDQYAWPFSGYKLIPGKTACRANITLDERYGLVEPLALFLRTLHAVPVPTAASWGLVQDPLQKCNPEKRVPQLIERLDKIEEISSDCGGRRHASPLNLSCLRVLAEQSTKLEPPVATTLVHGDLYARHLLLNDAHELTAVIDWGDIHIGTPATDLAIAHSFLPPDAHGKFRTTYGPISDDQWLLAKMRAAFCSTILVLYGRDTNDEALIREATTSLRFMVSDD